jgi:protein-disulfide isomerase
MLRRVSLALALLGLAACGSLQQERPTQQPTVELATIAPAPTASGAESPQFPRLREPLAAIPADDPRALGDSNAPVTIIEYSDFQCPYCLRHALGVFRELKSGYIETGKVRYVFRNFIAVEQHYAAPAAAVAGMCAAEQGQFWPLHDELFAKTREWTADPAAAPGVLLGYAENLGMDAAKFKDCQNDPAVAAQVNAETRQAEGLGIQGTPGFLIGQYYVSGAARLGTFEQAIALAEVDER